VFPLALTPATGRLIGAGLALAVLAGAFVSGCEVGQDRVQARWDAAALAAEREYREEVARLTAAAVARQAADTARQQALAERLAAERAETERLRAALSRSQLVNRPEPTDADPHPDPRLSEPFRLCWNAHWSGDPADRAACQAAGRAVSDAGGG
jgi:hypothetical protein